MSISIIIPVLNEEKTILPLLKYLKIHSNNKVCEVIVVDGNSIDQTIKEAKKLADKVITSPNVGRAIQMNIGAEMAAYDILYFVHADVTPPPNFYNDIIQSVSQGFTLGLYRQKFASKNPLLWINAFFSRFNKLWCRGGDQTLFITKKKFIELGGFDETFVVMEEYNLLSKVWKKEKIKIFDDHTLVSARKYSTNSWLRVQWANFIAFSMFKSGRPPAEIKDRYFSILKKYNNY